MAELRENRVKRKLQRGEVATVVTGTNDPDLIDFMGHLGFDGAWLEGEHGPVDFADIANLSRACDLWGMTPLVRVHQNEHGLIYRTLDCGAQGVVIPHVNTIEEARAIVDAAKYHPLGHRGNFTGRQGYGVDGYVNKANEQTMVVALIEETEGVRNLADILKVNYIDVFLMAPGDLAQSMGHLGKPAHPEVQAAVDKGVAQIIGAGKVAGVVASDSNVEEYIKKGARFLITGWNAWVASGARGYLDKVNSASGQSRKSRASG